LRVALLASLALCLGYVPASRMPAVQQVEAQLLDLRFRWRQPAPPADDIILVLIDDESIREIGRWPWSRAVIADGLARLTAAGARTIGIDLLFAEPEVGELPPAWLDSLRGALGDAAGQGGAAGLDADRVLARFLDRVSGDAEFAAEMRAAGNIVLPFSFAFSQPPEVSPPEPLPAVRAAAFRIVHGPGTARALLPLVASSMLAPIPELAQAAATLGHTNLLLDGDGAARFEFPAVAYGQEVYPSFALELARQHLGVPRDQVRLELRRGVWFGDRLIPTDERTRLVVNYRGPARFRTISFARLLARDLAGSQLAGKVVLIGGTAGGIGETFATPFDQYLPGIEWRATVIDNILRQDFVVHRQDDVLVDLGLLVLSGLLIGWLGQRSGLLRPSVGLAVAVTVVFATNLFAFESGRWLDLFLPLLGVVAIYTAVVLYKYFVGERQERRIRAAFKHYLSPTLVDQVARDPALLQLGGEQKELSVLFADLRHSTRIGAKLPPREFVELLNEVMEVMTGVLFAHDGMLDKFTGDGLVAIFGAPLPQPDHPLRACRAALAMIEALEPVQRRWARPELPPLEIGIGINTGSMLIGNMGSKERFSYTVIGDEANLGARLEAANKDFRTRILISEATWQRVKDEIATREIDIVTLRGMARPVRVFEVIGMLPLPGAEARRLEQFAHGLAAWRRQRWAEAEVLFEQVLASAPDDRPSRIYLERCRARGAERPEAAAAK
jgi:adenylate cyclase